MMLDKASWSHHLPTAKTQQGQLQNLKQAGQCDGTVSGIAITQLQDSTLRLLCAVPQGSLVSSHCQIQEGMQTDYAKLPQV